MPSRYRRRIVEHLSDSRYEAGTAAELAQHMRIDAEDREAFNEAIEELVAARQIHRDSKGRLQLPAIPDELVGRISVHPRGFAFLAPETTNREGDLFIPQGMTGGALNGDTVRVAVRKEGRRGRGDRSEYIGEVVEVLERRKDRFVGTLRRAGTEWRVSLDDREFTRPIVVRDVEAKNARHGDKVVIEFVKFPDPQRDQPGVGVITELLGEAGRPDVETQAVIRNYDLPEPFEEACLEQARQLAREFEEISEEELRKREDLRETFILTIDPPDARDFDDAISIRRLDDGGFELGVHIADVSHFVKPGTPLDTEAAERGNSVYLPRHVIPMLPEVLSNGICSLQEGVDRLTKSAFITLDADGRVRSTRFSSSIIRSAKRLTYLEAEELIAGRVAEARKHAMSETEYPEPLLPALRLMDTLAKVIRKRRMKDGMIVLALPDVELEFDDEGNVIGAHPEDDASTHGLIEMFMVEANEAVASLFDRLEVPILRRTHPDPSVFDLGELRQFCRVAGINIPKNPTRFELQQILDATRNTPRQQAIHLSILKSLTKAEYSPALIGHFALASEHYAHFTSPIRRYPDLLVHRSLQAYLDATDNGRAGPRARKAMANLGRQLRDDPRCPDEERLTAVGQTCNRTERTAELAERSLRTFLVLQFLEREHLGDHFEGLVSGMTSNMVFVQIPAYLVEGGIAVRDIPVPQSEKGKKGDAGKPDRWQMNPNTGALVAQRSGATLSIGDMLPVQIVAVDPPARKLELRVVPEAERKGKGKDAKKGGAKEKVKEKVKEKGTGRKIEAKSKPAKKGGGGRRKHKAR